MDDHTPRVLHLFEGFGIELEYMIVSNDSLAVAPIADKLIEQAAGISTNQLDAGVIHWSNELAMHVIELKNPVPVQSMDTLPGLFQEQVERITAVLKPLGARLLPTGAHPFMNPLNEAVIWVHENTEIYRLYDSIFGCSGHGWSNLQSTHLNLPFANDQEFGRLHNAIRLVVSIIPGLTASTPMLDGTITGKSDSRLEAYRMNQGNIPEIAGTIVPEAILTAADYREHILEPMYRAVAPHDPTGILQEEWLNSRGAIARFERDAIEIRVIDSQECPRMDVAVCHLCSEVVRALTEERYSDSAQQSNVSQDILSRQFLVTIESAEHAPLHPEIAAAFGFRKKDMTVGQLWRELAGRLREAFFGKEIETIFSHGTLATRILRSLNGATDLDTVLEVYSKLSSCLHDGKPFVP